MTSLGKEDSLFGEKNNKRPLMRSIIDYKSPQLYIYQTDMDGSNYIQTPASLPLVACCTKFRMDSQGSLPMQVRECQRQLRIIFITELDMCRLAMNIVTFSYLLKKADFNVVVDHFAIPHIMRSKAEPATTRIKRLIELLIPYSFNLYYIKGKDMVLSDFLSRQKTDNNNPHEIIPISFTLKSIVCNHFYLINNKIYQPQTSKYLIQTRSQAKSSGIKVLEIHDMNKGLYPHVKLGKQRPLSMLPMHSVPPTSSVQPADKGPSTHPIPKPRIGQGRAGLRRKFRTTQPIPLPKQMAAQPITTHVPKAALSLPEPMIQSQENV